MRGIKKRKLFWINVWSIWKNYEKDYLGVPSFFFLFFLPFFFFVTVAAFVVVTAIGSLLFLVWTPSFSHHRPCFYAAWRPYNTKGLKKYGLLTALFKGTKYSVTILKAVSHFLGHNKRLEWLFNFVSGNLRLCAHGSRNNRIGVKCKVIPVYFVFCI